MVGKQGSWQFLEGLWLWLLHVREYDSRGCNESPPDQESRQHQVGELIAMNEVTVMGYYYLISLR